MGIAGCQSNILQKCAGGTTTPPAPEDKTADVASGSGVDPATLADLAAIKADATLGDGTWTGGAFTATQYVVLGDGNPATWDGATWTAYTGQTAPAPPPPPPPANLPCPDPGEMTVADASHYASDHHECAVAMLAAETAGQARVTLIDHLQHIIDSDPHV